MECFLLIQSRGGETSDKSFSEMHGPMLSNQNYRNFSEEDLGPKNTQDGVHRGITLQHQSQ